MSIREFINNSTGAFTYHRVSTSLFDLNGAQHTYDNNGYKIKSRSGAPLLSFDNTNNLNECVLKTTLTNSITPLQSTVINHQNYINNHETRLTAVEQSGGLVPVGISDILGVNNNANNRSITGLNDISASSLHVGTSYVVGNSLFAETVYGNNITTMQNQINSLITYNNNLKVLVSALASSLDLRDANGNILDVSNLL